MTALICILITAFGFTQTSHPDAKAAVEDWTVITRSAAADSAFLLEPRELPVNNVFTIKLRTTFRTDTPEGNAAREAWTRKTTAAMEGNETPTVAAIEVGTQVDCGRKRFRYNGVQTLYDDSGAVIESVEGNSTAPWQQMNDVPGSQPLFDKICGAKPQQTPTGHKMQSN